MTLSFVRRFTGPLGFLALAGSLGTVGGCSGPEGGDPVGRYRGPTPPPTGKTVAPRRVPDYDGPAWTGTIPEPGDWRAVPGLPAGCGARLSATPGVSISSLQWSACASGEGECEEATMSVGAGTPRLARYATFHEDSRGVHVWLEVNDQNPRWSIMWNLAGPTELVAYSPAGQSCALSVGSSVRGYEMHARLSEPQQTHSWAIRAPHEDPLRTTVTTLSSALSATEAVLWLGHGDGFVYTGTRIVPLEKGPSNPAPVKDAFSAGVMVAIDGGVLAIDAAEGARRDLGFYPISGAPPTLVLPVSDARQVEYLGVDPASGELIRIESEGGETFETVRVYASPVVKASAKLVSRFVTRIPRTELSKPSVVLNAGYLFVGAATETSIGRVIRVSDGAYWQVAFTGTPVFVNKDYVWTMTNGAGPKRSALQRRPFPKGIPRPSEL